MAFWIGLTVALVPVAPKPLPIVVADPLPPFLAEGIWRSYVPAGRSLVPVPLPEVTTGRTGMRWAALSGLEFPVPRGYFMGPANPPADRTGSWNAPPRFTSDLLARVGRDGLVPVITAADRQAFDADLRFWRAGAVVLVPGEAHEAQLRSHADRAVRPTSADGRWGGTLDSPARVNAGSAGMCTPREALHLGRSQTCRTPWLEWPRLWWNHTDVRSGWTVADRLIIRGAREHNLRDVNLDLPRDALIVFTGLSGSGKSSLAFDTIFAEGQRRYVESLSSYARQFLGQMDKPDVDFIEGLSPAVSIDQKSTSRNPRSTVGTITEVYDYLRLLFARIGQPHCPVCGEPISKQTPQQIVDRVLAMAEGTRFQVLAPVVRGRKGEYVDLFADLQAKGYARARVDGVVHPLTEPPKLKKQEKHTIEVVVDRLAVKATRQAADHRLGRDRARAWPTAW